MAVSCGMAKPKGQVTAVFDVAPRHPARALRAVARHPRRRRPHPAARAVRRRAHARLRQRPARQRAGAPRHRRARWSRSTASTTTARWWTHAAHRALLDAFGGLRFGGAVAASCTAVPRDREAGAGRAPRLASTQARRRRISSPTPSQELSKLAPEVGEEETLAARRQRMMQAEKVVGEINEAHEAVAGQPCAGADLLVRAAPAGTARRPGAGAGGRASVKALDALLDALDEARRCAGAGAARGGLRSARAGAHGGAAVRAARRLAQIQRRPR